MNDFELLKISFRTMLHILTKVHSIRACSKLNGDLHMSSPQIYAEGHFNSKPHFVLVDSYLHEYTIILICSFLDEYNENFIPQNFSSNKDRIIEFRKKVKPIINRINQWSDLYKYRNIILAHNFRTKDKKPIINNTESKIYFNAPNTKSELELLIQLSTLITQNIGNEFPELLNINFDEQLTDSIEVSYKNIDNKSEFKTVCDQIRKLGLSMTDEILDY